MTNFARKFVVKHHIASSQILCPKTRNSCKNFLPRLQPTLCTKPLRDRYFIPSAISEHDRSRRRANFKSSSALGLSTRLSKKGDEHWRVCVSLRIYLALTSVRRSFKSPFSTNSRISITYKRKISCRKQRVIASRTGSPTVTTP